MAEQDPRERILAAFDGRPFAGPEAICAVCTAMVPVSGAAIVAMTDANHRETVCASDDLAGRLEEIQFDLGEGPCVEASTTGRPVLIPDVREAQSGRWPMFLDAALRTPARALYSFPLRLGAIGVGVFDLHRVRPGPLSPAELSGALLCADLALWALLGARAGEEPDVVGPERWLTEMNPRRARVHQATGMVMAQMDIPAEAALATLRAFAFAAERPLNDVSCDVVARRLRFPQENP